MRGARLSILEFQRGTASARRDEPHLHPTEPAISERFHPAAICPALLSAARVPRPAVCNGSRAQLQSARPAAEPPPARGARRRPPSLCCPFSLRTRPRPRAAIMRAARRALTSPPPHVAPSLDGIGHPYNMSAGCDARPGRRVVACVVAAAAEHWRMPCAARRCRLPRPYAVPLPGPRCSGRRAVAPSARILLPRSSVFGLQASVSPPAGSERVSG